MALCLAVLLFPPEARGTHDTAELQAAAEKASRIVNLFKSEHFVDIHVGVLGTMAAGTIKTLME